MANLLASLWPPTAEGVDAAADLAAFKDDVLSDSQFSEEIAEVDLFQAPAASMDGGKGQPDEACLSLPAMMAPATEAEAEIEAEADSQAEALDEEATTAEDEIAAAAVALSALAASAPSSAKPEVPVREAKTAVAAEPHSEQPRDITTAFRVF